jgi:hypothetical protein
VVHLGLHSQSPLGLHVNGQPHVPHVPPQPSDPQDLPEQSGSQPPTHAPSWHVPPFGQPEAHLPPQPSSSPQYFPAQLAVHVAHWPSAQVWLDGQLPQEPPHPSSPQTFEPQAGVQSPHLLLKQALPVPHLPQDPPHPSSPQSLSEQSAVHALHSPATQVSPVSHFFPHLPQLSLSAASSMQSPSQHDPSSHAVHAMPHSGSFCPHENPWQLGVQATHLPDLHTSPSSGHGPSHFAPQPSLWPHSLPEHSGRHIPPSSAPPASRLAPPSNPEVPPSFPAPVSVVSALLVQA